MYLSAASLAVLAFTVWRTIDETRQHAAYVNAEQRAFNRELVASIEELAEKSGMLTSADYCPVRFRMRLPGSGIPARSFVAELYGHRSGGNCEYLRSVTSTDAGLIDFGLNSPGQYRVRLRASDGMVLEHDFDVLPGVPVDRVVICPRAAFAPDTPVDVTLDVNWPEEFASEDLLALVEIKPGPFESEGWQWNSNEGWPFQLLATTSPGSESFQEVVDHLQISGFVSDEVLQRLYPPDAVPLPHRYCMISAITFVHRHLDGRSREQFRLLGTFHYEPDGRDTSGADDCWDAIDPPPLYEANPDFVGNHWTLDLPQDCVQELLKRIQDIPRSTEMAT